MNSKKLCVLNEKRFQPERIRYVLNITFDFGNHGVFIPKMTLEKNCLLVISFNHQCLAIPVIGNLFTLSFEEYWCYLTSTLILKNKKFNRCEDHILS